MSACTPLLLIYIAAGVLIFVIGISRIVRADHSELEVLGGFLIGSIAILTFALGLKQTGQITFVGRPLAVIVISLGRSCLGAKWLPS